MNKKIVLMIADITSVAADVIVNSANQSMLAGSGLCRIIHVKAGEELSSACKELNHQNKAYPVGTALVTPAGNLPAHHVIHAVGPKWYESKDKETELVNTYANILNRAEELGAKIISVPTISTGIHRYPELFAAEIVMGFLIPNLPKFKSIETVIIACGNESNASAYKEVITNYDSNDVTIVDLVPNLSEL